MKSKEIPGNIEKVTPTHTIPAWRIDAKDKQYAMRSIDDEHRTRITPISQEDDYIITYTDGSMKEKEQENHTGAGWI